MRIHRDLETQQYYWPVKNSAAAIVSGALLMPGVTAETDLGVLIPASGAGADAVGILQGPVAAADVNTLVAGTAWLVKEVVPVAPMRIIRAAYDFGSAVATGNTSSGTTVTITSLEDNIDTSYLYIYSGTAIGQLQYLATSSSGSAVTKTAFSPAVSSTDTFIKILRLFHKLHVLSTNVDKLGTTAAVGTWKICVMQNYIRYGGITSVMVPCAPTLGANGVGVTGGFPAFTVASGLTGLNNYSDLEFQADIAIRNSAAYVSA